VYSDRPRDQTKGVTKSIKPLSQWRITSRATRVGGGVWRLVNLRREKLVHKEGVTTGHRVLWIISRTKKKHRGAELRKRNTQGGVETIQDYKYGKGRPLLTSEGVGKVLIVLKKREPCSLDSWGTGERGIR